MDIQNMNFLLYMTTPFSLDPLHASESVTALYFSFTALYFSFTDLNLLSLGHSSLLRNINSIKELT